MKPNCPTTQYIQACAKAAAALGAPGCLTKIGGVLVTVHAPVPPKTFDTRITSKTVAMQLLRDSNGRPHQLRKDLHSAH